MFGAHLPKRHSTMPVRMAAQARSHSRVDNHIPQPIRPHSRVNSKTVTSAPQALRIHDQPHAQAAAHAPPARPPRTCAPAPCAPAATALSPRHHGAACGYVCDEQLQGAPVEYALNLRDLQAQMRRRRRQQQQRNTQWEFLFTLRRHRSITKQNSQTTFQFYFPTRYFLPQNTPFTPLLLSTSDSSPCVPFQLVGTCGALFPRGDKGRQHATNLVEVAPALPGHHQHCCAYLLNCYKTTLGEERVTHDDCARCQ
jgi:hypothetical protein